MTFIRPERNQALHVEMYKVGWADEMSNSPQCAYSNPHHQMAYDKGRRDYTTTAIAEDSVINMPTDSEIAKRLKN